MMKLLTILIGFFGVQSVFTTQCQEPVDSTTSKCMEIIHPQHELLEKVPYLPQECLGQITGLLNKLREDINNGLSSHNDGKCFMGLTRRVDDISTSYMAKIINVDRITKQRYLDVYTAIGNAIVEVQQCVHMPHASCEVMRGCCTNAKNKLYFNQGTNVRTIANFLNEFSTKFEKECDSILSSIRDVQKDLSSC